MRALALAIVVAAVAVARLAVADAPTGFDHMVHDRTIVVDGHDPIACNRCHVDTVAGRGFALARPVHASCFGAGCHGAAPATPRPGAKPAIAGAAELRICVTCHAESLLALPYKPARPSPFAKPVASDPEFAVVIGHAKHAAIACAQCHAELPTKIGVPHARCTPACHDGAPAKGPAMERCEVCHARAAGAPQPPRLEAATLPVAFAHKAHALRSAAGRACATCHAGVATTDDNRLPRPTVQTCAIAGCHDARAAFSVVAAACTKCHRAAPVRTFVIERPIARYSHAVHMVRANERRACEACHRLVPSGEVATAKHEQCTGSGCHDAEFGDAKPTICGACHNTTEPWRALTVDRAPADASEFGATLDHAKHARPDRACTTCHRLRTATRELRTPRGHATCTGAGCHAIADGPAPHLADCIACHLEGLEAARDTARRAAPWTVRGTFVHDKPHAALACEACHDNTASPTVLALATPAKARCTPCHDGVHAFKVTGTSCTKCHGTPR